MGYDLAVAAPGEASYNYRLHVEKAPSDPNLERAIAEHHASSGLKGAQFVDGRGTTLEIAPLPKGENAATEVAWFEPGWGLLIVKVVDQRSIDEIASVVDSLAQVSPEAFMTQYEDNPTAHHERGPHLGLTHPVPVAHLILPAAPRLMVMAPGVWVLESSDHRRLELHGTTLDETPSQVVEDAAKKAASATPVTVRGQAGYILNTPGQDTTLVWPENGTVAYLANVGPDLIQVANSLITLNDADWLRFVFTGKSDQ